MKATITHTSYSSAMKIIAALLDAEVDCVFQIEENKAFIEASNMEAWVRVQLSASEIEGSGKVYTKLEYLQTLKPKSSIVLTHVEDTDHIEILMGKTRGAIKIIDEDEALVNAPEDSVKICSAIPTQLLIFATSATAFKPLLAASTPNAILEINNKFLKLTSYDTYMGTIYKTENEEVKANNTFKLTVDMEYWKKIVGCFTSGLTAKMGSTDKLFRVKTEEFDFYHAMIDEDTQDVEEVIDSLRKNGNPKAKVQFDGKEVVDAIDSAKGIIRSGDKEGARLIFHISKDEAIMSTASDAGSMETNFDVLGYEGEEDITFTVSSDGFSDTLKLTRDENIKYCHVDLTIFDDYLIMESTKIPAASITPVINDNASTD